MRCRRFLLRRKFVPYLEGKLPPREGKRLEKHMLDCERCRTLFERSRAGHRLAQELHQLNPEDSRRAPEYGAMKTDLGKQATGFRRWVRVWENGLYALTTHRGVQVLIVLVLALAAVLVVSNWKILFRERNGIPVNSSALAFSDFHPVSISELQSNTQPHIVTEGYVRDVRVDEQEGTLHFKLVESPQGTAPFVVCEVMSPVGMTLPREGSRVRVYGVARYDGQPGRKWYEVNPVLNIALLKR